MRGLLPVQGNWFSFSSAREKIGTIIVLCSVVIFISGAFPASAKLVEETELKAMAFLNVMKFIQWPDKKTVQQDKEEFAVGIIGENPFGGYLETLKDDETIGNKPIVVYYYHSLSGIPWQNLDVLFLSDDQKFDVKEVLNLAKFQKVLPVSHCPQFCDKGGVITIKTQGQQLALEVNVAESKNYDVRISAKLLTLSKVVETKKKI